MGVRPGLLLLALLPLAAACSHQPPAAPPVPHWDAQWDSYSGALKADEEKARREKAGGPAAPKTCSGGPSPVSPQAAEPIAAAKQAMYDGKYQTALDRTDIAIGLDPKSAAAWEVRGSAFYTLGRVGEAKLAWTRAFELDPCLKEIPAFLEKLKSTTGGQH